MNPIKAFIVDDEPKAAENLKSLLSTYYEGIIIVGTATTIKSATELINQLQPDVVFLDIELQHGTGFDLLRCFSKIDFQIIFVTAYQEYAIKAIKVGALDYILKPIDLDELDKVILKLKQEFLKKTNDTSSKYPSKQKTGKLILHSTKGFSIVDIKNILYCKSDGNYLHFVCRDGTDLLVTTNMKEYESVLEEYDFCRIHRSYLVNLRAVKHFIKTDGGMVVLENGSKLPVATRKKDFFMFHIENLNASQEDIS